MEGSAHSTDQTVSDDGVTVRQRYTDTEFDLPSVVFTLTSEREDTVTVRFVVPDIEAEKVGLHPQFRSDAWTVTEERLVFEATVDPGEEVTTLYALDRDDESVFERAMDSLRIEEVAPLTEATGPSLDLTLDHPVGRDDDRTDTDLAAAGPPAGPAEESTASDGGGTAPDANRETTDTERERETPDTERERETADNEADGDPAAAVSDDGTASDSAPADADSDLLESHSSAGEQSGADDTALAGQSTAALVEELLHRLEDDDLPPAHRERLAEQVGRGPRGADAARLASLQTRVSDIEAFTDPVEQLLDRHGPPAEAFDAFEKRLEAVETLDERVRELETRVETVDDHDERIERLDEQVGTVDERVAHLDERVGTVDERVGTVDERVADLGENLDTTAEELRDNLASIEAEMETVREQLEAVETDVENVREEASDAGERAEAVEADLTDIEEQLSGLQNQVEDIAGDWESMEEDVTALQEWRSDLARTFNITE